MALNSTNGTIRPTGTGPGCGVYASNFFLYGSLRLGQASYKAFRLADRCTYLGPAKLPQARLYRLGWFPGVKLGYPGSEVVGDLFSTTDPELVDALDGYEGYHPGFLAESLYIRRLETVVSAPGKILAWLYEYNGNPNPENYIESGDWLSGTIIQRG